MIINVGGLDVPTNTLFLYDNSYKCRTVTATDDSIYEVDSQTFTLALTLVNPSSPAIMLTDPSTATITVMDDEGILYILYCFCKPIIFCRPKITDI